MVNTVVVFYIEIEIFSYSSYEKKLPRNNYTAKLERTGTETKSVGLEQDTINKNHLNPEKFVKIKEI